MKLKLLEKIDGYEEVVEYRYLTPGDYFIDGNGDCTQWSGQLGTVEKYIVLTPERKVVDWGKVDGTTRVEEEAGEHWSIPKKHLSPGMIESGDFILSKEWQAHTIGGECPVDPGAFYVEFREKPGENRGAYSIAWDISWSLVTQYRVIRLADGYEYK